MKNIYIASCAEEGGILRCELSAEGKLVPAEFVPLDRPMYMAVEGGVLYALLRAPFPESVSSGLVRIPLDAQGQMERPEAPKSCPGTVCAHLSLLKGRIYTANYISGDISLLPDMTVSHGEGAHPHFIAPTPDGDFIAVADLGTDSIYTYSPQLELINRVSLPQGSGCRHISFSPDGHYAYCVNEISSTLSILTYDRGVFSLLDTVSALPGGWEGFNAAAAVRCEDDCVWISHRGFDHISCFERRGDELLISGQLSCGGRWPRDFILTGGYILCANEKSDTVTVLREGEILHSLSVKCPVAIIAG